MRLLTGSIALGLLCLAPFCQSAQAQHDGPTTVSLTLTPVFTQLETPPIVMMREAVGEGRIYLLAVSGQLFSFPKSDDPAPGDLRMEIDLTPLLGTTSVDQGTYSFAFAPDFTDSRVVYINYASSIDNRLTISRFNLTDGPAEALASEQVLIRAESPRGFLHYGGNVEFGPDGYLYISTGDGNAGFPAQSVASYLGKVLRIDVNGTPEEGLPYFIPPDNPYVGVPGALPEIYAIGLRNPYRFSFSPIDGALFLGDPGENYAEEVNIVEKGGNYGWPFREADLPYNESLQADRVDLIDPDYVYDVNGAESRQAIIGGHVYAGEAIPELFGVYVFGDFSNGAVVGLEEHVDALMIHELALANLPGANIAGISVDGAGEIYVLAFPPVGGIYRLEKTTPVRSADQAQALLGTGTEGVDANSDIVLDAADVTTAVIGETAP